MPDAHLTPDQITAIRDGELHDWEPVRHLRSCPECHSRLREARALRVLLSRTESERSPHPGPEALAAYAEAMLTSRSVRELEAHVAACPQCFADLDGIRTHLRPEAGTEDAPPEWRIAAAARRFVPPRSPLNLGTLIVEWLHRIGLSLDLIPPTEEGLPSQNVAFDSIVADLAPALPRVEIFSPRSRRLFTNYLAQSVPPTSEEEPEATEIPTGMAEGSAPAEEESIPVEVTVGDLLGRITIRSRGRAHVMLLIAVTRQQDNTPVPGVRLSLEADEGTRAEATTDAAGMAEFLLPQGRATLAFLSPLRAELTITF